MDSAGRTRNRFSGYFSPRRKHGCARGSFPAMICHLYHPHLPRQYQAELRSALMCHLTRRSTIFLSTSHIDPWVPSLISSYNGTSQVDVILTADPNRSLTTWESPVVHLSLPTSFHASPAYVYGARRPTFIIFVPLLLQVFILFFRVLIPLFAVWTAWLGVTYMWQEIRAAKGPKEWRWRLPHLIMIVEVNMCYLCHMNNV